MSKRWKKRVNQNNKDTMKLSELIALMMSKYAMSEEEHNAILTWEEFNINIERQTTSEEQAKQTFSIEAIAGVTATFHLWLLGRVKDRWETEDWDSDKAPHAISVNAKVDWSNDI